MLAFVNFLLNEHKSACAVDLALSWGAYLRASEALSLQ